MSIAKTNLELQTSVFVNAILQGKTQKDASSLKNQQYRRNTRNYLQNFRKKKK